MEAIHDAPFYDAATSNSACLPFVVAAHKNSQDRLIIGPSIFANNQIQLFNWLYRDIAPTMRLPAFRLGKALDFVVAARIYPIDIKETISSRRDGVVVVGLVAERGSPAALCSHLGLVVRQIAAVVAREELSLPGETEASLMALLGYTVAQTPLSFDWSSRAQLALDLCAEIPRFERIRQARAEPSLASK